MATAATAPVGHVRRSRTLATSVSETVRERTRKAHVRAEQAFALEERLASRDAYARLLVRLRGYYVPLEEALVAWESRSATEGLDVAARMRAGLLDVDLAVLGRPHDGSGTAQVTPPVLGDLPQALGWLYVLEGSALGGRVIARRALRRLGADLPVAFFTGADGPDLGGRWRSLRTALDGLGPDAADDVVAAAEAGFALFAGWLRSEVPPR